MVTHLQDWGVPTASYPVSVDGYGVVFFQQSRYIENVKIAAKRCCWCRFIHSRHRYLRKSFSSMTLMRDHGSRGHANIYVTFCIFACCKVRHCGLESLGTEQVASSSTGSGGYISYPMFRAYDYSGPFGVLLWLDNIILLRKSDK